ncbi:MAG: single-stranded-DNA-specific exonuclease RecJ [Succinivibrio sp.]
MKIVRRAKVEDSHLAAFVSDPVIRQILARRGIKSLSDVECALCDILHYRDLHDISKASSIIADAIEAGDPILVAGDYDVDGITGTALGVRGLKDLGAKDVTYYVPSRYEGGYGVSPQAIDSAIEHGVRLILTVDNGVSCRESIDYAKSKGLKVVITDHHETPECLPDADAIVDPKLPDDVFPSKNLCGAGVLFYVLVAVRACLKGRGFFEGKPFPKIGRFLDLVALGTIGDVMVLDPNNRKLVKFGFEKIRNGECLVGIKALAASCRVDLSSINATSIAFDLCPRLNAPGRIKLENNPAVALMLTDDDTEASIIARELEMCNRRRGDYERVFLKEACEDANLQSGNSAIVLYRPNWLVGLGGLIASRIKEKFSVPCFVFSGEGEELSGSARSVPGFSIVKILQSLSEKSPDLLIRYGGHAMAAGASIRRSNFEKFKELFNQVAKECLGQPSDEELISDGSLPSNYVTIGFARDLESYGPWGNGFEEPCFDGIYTVEDTYLVANRHLRFKLRNEDGSCMNAIKLRANTAERQIKQGDRVSAAYTVGVNHYMGSQRLEIKIISIQPVL